MKVGILTFHLAYNYGAVLQCYALQEVIRSMGHDVCVIDYKQPFMANLFRPTIHINIKTLIKLILEGKNPDYYVKNGLMPLHRSLYFIQFRKKYLLLSPPAYSENDIPECDIYIVGSDQPWNPDLTGGVDPIYWGNFKRPKDSKLITYAMSTSEKSLQKVGWDKVIKYCDNFDALAFREESITKIIEEKTNRSCSTTVDPTLLADAELWSPLLNKKWKNKKYLLLYHVGGPKDVIEQMTQRAKQMAKVNGLKFIDASNYNYSPENFISLIKYAQCVITASFHAAVFSIIFNTPFYVIRTGQASDIRLTNLLNKTGNNNLFVNPSFKLDRQQINSNTIEFLRFLKSDSFDYLSKILI